MNAFDKTTDALADAASEGAKTGRRFSRQVAAAGDAAGSDIRALLKDLESALKEGKDDDVGALRSRLEARLSDARATYDDAQHTIRQKLQAAAETTDDFVRGRPWETIGAAAGIAFLLGVIIGRG
ncbi:DUF883 family protein [Robbsia andropogonis]|uniref:DUF883 family protein n=1 Tax=Robbsia andropogonis TaxID=28092 RepID=UPI003D1A4C01